MHHSSGVVAIELQYTLGANGEARLRKPFFDALAAIRHEGSIAAAARKLGWSYRHLWGYLKDQEKQLGRGLIHWDKGRAARLTEFAEKLLWAETRVCARLAPQVENLVAEIGRELSVAFDDTAQIADCVASHDLSLPLLRRLCQTDRAILLDLRYASALEALAQLSRGGCAFAGIHLPHSRPELARRGSTLHRAFGAPMQHGRARLIRTAQRTQGLFVARGNPLGVRGIDDLPRLRFVNRAPGTGTRLLLEELLAQHRIDAAGIRGFGHEEANHLAVAAAVASGAADAGFGIQAAAAGTDLDFVPLVVEDYFLVCEDETLRSPVAQAIVSLLASARWREQVERLAGYSAQGAGEVLDPRDALPWHR